MLLCNRCASLPGFRWTMVSLLRARLSGFLQQCPPRHGPDGRSHETHDRTRRRGPHRFARTLELATLQVEPAHVWTELGLAHPGRPLRLQAQRPLLLSLQRWLLAK